MAIFLGSEKLRLTSKYIRPKPLSCPHCGHPKTACRDPRPAEVCGRFTSTRRNRYCPECEQGFFTLEISQKDLEELINREAVKQARVLMNSLKQGNAA